MRKLKTLRFHRVFNFLIFHSLFLIPYFIVNGNNYITNPSGTTAPFLITTIPSFTAYNE